jgi:predicted chitinase
MSVESALRAAGVSSSIARREAPLASAAMLERGITTRARARDFLAQVLHESGGLRWFEEIASGEAYEWRRDLGNVRAGDGRRFKGRGPIQLTGRANYRWAAGRLGLPLESNPSLASQHAVGWRIAALFWQSRGLNAYADRGDFLTITKRINGGTNGWADRVRYRNRLAGHDCRPRRPSPYAGLTASERRWCRRYDTLLRLKRQGRDTKARRTERVELRAAMTRQRKAIWRTAGKSRGGWGRASRRKRYSMLLRRTR